MTKSTLWINFGRTYGLGYKAPSTAQFNIDRAHIFCGDKEKSYPLNLPEESPDFMDLLLNIVPLPLKNNPQISCEGHQRPLFDGILKKYQYAGIQLQATNIGRVNNQFISLKEKRFRFAGSRRSPLQNATIENIPPKPPIAFEFYYDNITENVFFDRDKGSLIWAMGGPGERDLALHQYQQVFVSFFLDDNIIKHNVSPLENWWKEGIYPPFNMAHLKNPIQNISVDANYKTLQDALRQGEMLFSICIGVDETGKDIGQIYQSIEVTRHGQDQVMVTFERI